jgi:hypothetical protein
VKRVEPYLPFPSFFCPFFAFNSKFSDDSENLDKSRAAAFPVIFRQSSFLPVRNGVLRTFAGLAVDSGKAALKRSLEMKGWNIACLILSDVEVCSP